MNVEKCRPTTYKEIEALVCALKKKYAACGLNNVYFAACGGSLGGLAPMHNILNAEAKTFRSTLINAACFVNATPKQVDDSALVITMSASGNTPETVAAAAKAKELGATVITLSRLKGTELESKGDHHIGYGFKDCPYTETSTAILMRFAFELLDKFDEYEHYQTAVESFKILDSVCDTAFEKSTVPARKFAEAYKNEDLIYTVGSGNSAMVAYTTCICHFMEMEWIHSSYIHAGEFFHGPFEVAQPEIPYVVLMNFGRTRKLDERVIAFLEKHSDRLVIIDAMEYGIDQFDSAVAEHFNTIILAIVARQYTETLAIAKKHPFGYRRYMFKVDY